MLTLGEHLRAGARRPFAWGEADCLMWLADWIHARRGVDPAAAYRGRYRTAIGAARHVRRRGGLEAMVRGLAAEAGLAVTAEPGPGDVALVRDPVAGPLGAIRTPVAWAAKAPAGIALAPYPVIVAWRV